MLACNWPFKLAIEDMGLSRDMNMCAAGPDQCDGTIKPGWPSLGKIHSSLKLQQDIDDFAAMEVDPRKHRNPCS